MPTQNTHPPRIFPRRAGRLTRLLSRLGVSPEVLPAGFGITLSGRGARLGEGRLIPVAQTLTVHDCRRILQYTPSEIRLSVSGLTLAITGSELRFSSFVGGEVTVLGEVKGVAWL